MNDEFHIQVQYAGFGPIENIANNRRESNVCFDDFIFEYDNFPWSQEENLWWPEDAPSQQIVVGDGKLKSFLRVYTFELFSRSSIAVELCYRTGERESIFFKDTQVSYCKEIYTTSDVILMKECFKLFFDRDIDELCRILKAFKFSSTMHERGGYNELSKFSKFMICMFVFLYFFWWIFI